MFQTTRSPLITHLIVSKLPKWQKTDLQSGFQSKVMKKRKKNILVYELLSFCRGIKRGIKCHFIYWNQSSNPGITILTQSRNMTSGDPALNWDTAHHEALSQQWDIHHHSGSGLDARLKDSTNSGIVMRRRPPWLLLHLPHLLYRSLSLRKKKKKEIEVII